MKFDDCTYKAFLALLGNSLWDSPIDKDVFPLTSHQWDTLYRMSWAQAVTGLLYDGLAALPGNSGISSSQVARWMTSATFIEENNLRMGSIIRSMAWEWKRLGINALLQKGQNIARMYPIPGHRVSGDVDWYIPGRSNFKAALQAVRGYHPEKDSDGDYHYQREGTVVELHRRGSDPEDPIAVLIMINEHILHHAMVMGIGYRHFCDMAIAYRYYQGKYDPKKLRHELHMRNLLHWTHLLNAFLVKILNMPVEYLPFAVQGGNDIRSLEYLVICDGNLGLNKENRMAGFSTRAPLFLKYAPARFLGRWSQLAFGRLMRMIKKH